ncbi:MAG: hypothetical protein K6F90_01800 [Lachnospiraceae bacterium]|nr:hypothetical protein [Lachnospiraceae bacterium]
MPKNFRENEAIKRMVNDVVDDMMELYLNLVGDDKAFEEGVVEVFNTLDDLIVEKHFEKGMENVANRKRAWTTELNGKNVFSVILENSKDAPLFVKELISIDKYFELGLNLDNIKKLAPEGCWPTDEEQKEFYAKVEEKEAEKAAKPQVQEEVPAQEEVKEEVPAQEEVKEEAPDQNEEIQEEAPDQEEVEIDEELGDDPKFAGYDKETYKNLLEKEKTGDIKGVAEIIAESYYLMSRVEAGLLEDPLMESKMAAVKRYQNSFIEDKEIREEKKDIYEKLSNETALRCVKLQIEAGKEVEAFAQKIEKGEVAKTEGIKDNKEARFDLAKNYVAQKSVNVAKKELTLSGNFEILDSIVSDDAAEFNVTIDMVTAEYLSKESDGLTPEQKKKYFELGDGKDSDKARKYGYFINKNAKLPGDPEFTLNRSAERKNILSRKDSTPAELNQVYDELSGMMNTAVEYQSFIAEVREQARDMLKDLDNMTKEGHNNNKTFTDMRKALKDVTDINLNTISNNDFSSMMYDLKNASDTYTKSHDRLFRKRWGYGNDRFNMSKKLSKFAKEARDTTFGGKNDINDKVSLTSQIADISDMMTKADEMRRGERVSVKALKNEEGMKENKDILQVENQKNKEIKGFEK